MIGYILMYGAILLFAGYYWWEERFGPKVIDRGNDASRGILSSTSSPALYKAPVKTAAKQNVRIVDVPNIQSDGHVLPKYWVVNVAPSPAESLIITELNKYGITYLREVCFEGFVNQNGNHYRLDFFVPELRLVIEYDSKLWHGTPEAQVVDFMKDQFCAAHGIKMIRLGNKDYYKLEERIADLMLWHDVVHL